MKNITINGKEYKIKYTIRALFIFEQITNKAFEIKTLLDNYVFFYSIILANNEDNVLDWNDFIEALDNDPTIFNQINEAVNETTKINELMDGGEENEKGQKKS